MLTYFTFGKKRIL